MPNNDWLRAMTGIAPDKEPAQDVGDPGEHYYNPEWDRGQSLENDPLALFNHQQTLKRMLRESANPALFAQGVDDITKVRMTIDSAKQPEPVSIWEPVATELRASAALFGGGLLAVPAALASIPHVITGSDGDSPFIALTEKARAHYDAASDERSEQAQRNAEAGGGRVKMIVGSLIGQAPEMLATGFGATSAVKSLFQMGTKAALTTAQLKNAFMASTAIQGGLEGVKNTVGRMAENVADGEEALQASDVAAGLAIAAVTMFTEIPGGMRGEYRALSQGGWRAKAADAAKDFVIQPGQEAFQEGATQIINDLADGSYINWSEVGWSALAGAIGGGMFAVPGAVSALTSHATDPIAAAEIVRVATAAAKAPEVIRHSEAVAAAVGKAAATPEIAKQSETTLRQLFQSDTGGNIHLTLDDFKIIAQKRGSSVESLLIEMGGNSGGGDVAIPTENFMANMVKNSPELMEEAKTMIKSEAGSPSRKDLADIIDAMESLKQRKFEDMLPDGKTADDSQKIVAEMTAETVTAAAVSKAKLTDAQVRTAAELAAVQFRTAAIQWNTAYEAQGKTERVTPKQLYDKYRAQITGIPGSKSDTTMSQDAYHGTGNSTPYDRFAYDKVGGPGGEGAQAYGWGLYFTSLKQVAEAYRSAFGVRNLSLDQEYAIGLEMEAVFGQFPEDFGIDVESVMSEIDDKAWLRAEITTALANKDPAAIIDLAWDFVDGDVTREQLDAWGKDNLKLKGIEKPGKVYTAEIPEDSDMLDWDQEVPQSVISKIDQAILDGINTELEARNMGDLQDGGYTGKQLYKILAKNSDLLPNSDPDNDKKAASDYLLSIGIPGIKYLGEAKKAGKDITNYVIFDDSKVQIKALEQGNGAAPRGEYDYVSKIIRLGADANPSTIHHELMHHWLEVTKSWASDPSAPDVFRHNLTDIGAWASKNAGKVASVYKKVSGKEVSTEAIAAAAGDMQNLNLNSQAGKAIHEAVAYGYEQYLTEGKAPTKELKRIFKQIANYFNKIIKQLMRSEILTDPALTKVFDRMLTASDAKAIAHLSPQAIEASGMSAEMATLLNGLYGEQLADAQQQAYAKVLEQVKKDYEVELLAKAEEIKSTLMTQPVYKAQAGMATKPMDAEKVKSILAGTEHTGIDLSLYTTDKGGVDPLAARDEYGFTGSPLDMLIELSASKPVNTVARDAAEASFDAENRMSPSDMAQEIIDSDTGSLMIAAAELRALRAAAKVSGQAAKEATVAGKEATKEAVAVSTAELKTKIKQMADKAKMDKQTHDESLTNFKNWVNSIAKSGLSLEAQKRLDAEPTTVEAIAKQIATRSAKAVKLASRDQLEAAFREQVEVATLTEMQRILDRTAADTAAADVADTVSLLKRDIKNDVRILAAWAKEVVRRMPMADLKPDVWARRVEAARSRREVAAAKGDKDGIKKASEDIVYSLAMQHEILRTAAVRQEMSASLIKHTTAKELQYLADAGYPMVKVGNEIRVFSTMEEAEAAAYTGPHGTQVTRTTDLHDIGRSIAGILSSKREVQVAAVQALESLAQSNPGLIVPEVQRMLADGKISVNYATDFVKSFTTDDFSALTAQVVFLRNEAKNRPTVAKEQGKLIADGVNAIPKDAVKQTENMFYRFMFHTMKNVTLHLHVLGDFGKKIVAKMDDSSTNEMEYKRQVAKVLSPAQNALRKSGIDLDERKTILGVDTSRHEDLVRLLMLGTKTGRQRVIADLAMRSKDVNANQYIATISQVTDVEAAWLSAMWEANDLMWSWDVAAAKANGIPLPKTLEATPVPVIVGDKIVGLRGGYASVPYVGSEGPAFEMLTDSKIKPADVARGLYLDREEVVEGHRLDLTSEAQTRSQISHMRTAAFLGLATDMRVLLANDSPFSINATEKLGKGWVADFKQYLQFTVAGVKPSTHFERGFQFLGFAQQLAVFGFNITTAVSQITGVIGSMGHPKIGPKAMLGASGRILSEIIGNGSVAAPFQRIGSQSVEMLHRPGGQSLDILSIDKIEGKQTFAGKFRDWGTAPMRRMQQVVDTITYQAAYDRAIAELPADLKGDMRLAAAKRIATDAVKETQGTALRSRQSEIAHTQMGVCFTFAGKWMMNNANWLATLYYDSKRQGWKGGKSDFAVAVLTSVLAGTAAMIALRAVLQPEDDDDERHDLQDYATKWAIDSLAQPHYLGRYVAHVAQLMVTEQTWNRPVDTLPQLSQFTSGASMVINQMKDSQDSDDVQKIIAGLIGMGSIVPGVPSVQLKRSTDALFSGAQDGWKDPWETFVQSVFGADRVPRIAD